MVFSVQNTGYLQKVDSPPQNTLFDKTGKLLVLLKICWETVSADNIWLRGILQCGHSPLTPALHNTSPSPALPPGSCSLAFLMFLQAHIIPLGRGLRGIFPLSPLHGAQTCHGNRRCTQVKNIKGGFQKKKRSLTPKDSDAHLEFWNYLISCSQNLSLKEQINLKFLKKQRNKRKKTTQKLFQKHAD